MQPWLVRQRPDLPAQRGSPTGVRAGVRNDQLCSVSGKKLKVQWSPKKILLYDVMCSFQDQDVHSYIVTEDGRTYTALSKMPIEIGAELQVTNLYFNTNMQENTF